MLAGFVLFSGVMIWMIVCNVRYLLNDTIELPQQQYGPYLWIGKLGLVLCLIAWLWSLWSSIAILRQMRNTP